MTFEAHSADATLAESLLGGVEATDLVSGYSLEHPRAVIAFVGMAFEARIAAGPGVAVFSRHARRELASAAATAARHGCRGIISFGVAGGLAPGLRPGDCIVASAVLESQTSRATDTAWSNRLLDVIGRARHAPILGVDTPVAEPARKRELHQTTGAAAVDMESHVVAQVAAAHGLAFTALRVIVDPAGRTIPPAALVGMSPEGRANVKAILRSLVARPSQLGPLTRVALDALAARAEMQRVRQLLGPHFGLAEVARMEAVKALA
jgi:hopanoid-associated phosphorylase